MNKNIQKYAFFVKALLIINFGCQTDDIKNNDIEDVIQVASTCAQIDFQEICPLNTSLRANSSVERECERDGVIQGNSICKTSGACSVQCDITLECDGSFVVTQESVICVDDAVVSDCSNIGLDLNMICPENSTPVVNSMGLNSCNMMEREDIVCISVGQCTVECTPSCEYGLKSIEDMIIICNQPPACGNNICEGIEGDVDSEIYCQQDCNPVCETNSRKCNSDTLLTCTESRIWDDGVICPDGQYCRGSEPNASCVSITDEVCDGIDNDFDDRVDEELTRPFERQLDICRGATQTCVDGQWSEPVAPGNALFERFYESVEVSCDQVDNDCNGNTDINDARQSLCCQNPSCTGVEWVSIPGGTFNMGSNDQDMFTDRERPVRQVSVPAFEIMKSEVTTAHYRACVASGNCPNPEEGGGMSNFYQTRDADRTVENLPMNLVSWTEARTFCQWMGGDLPSEAQWEYTARRVTNGIFPWQGTSDTLSCNRAHYLGCADYIYTINVCTKPAGNSTDGVCDLIGNVAEWTRDDYVRSYSELPTNGSAYCARESCIPDGISYKSVRGGSGNSNGNSFFLEFRLITSIGRNSYYLTQRESSIGFRCVK